MTIEYLQYSGLSTEFLNLLSPSLVVLDELCQIRANDAIILGRSTLLEQCKEFL